MIYFMLMSRLDPSAEHAGISAAGTDGKWRSPTWMGWGIPEVGQTLALLPRTQTHGIHIHEPRFPTVGDARPASIQYNIVHGNEWIKAAGAQVTGGYSKSGLCGEIRTPVHLQHDFSKWRREPETESYILGGRGWSIERQ